MACSFFLGITVTGIVDRLVLQLTNTLFQAALYGHLGSPVTERQHRAADISRWTKNGQDGDFHSCLRLVPSHQFHDVR